MDAKKRINLILILPTLVLQLQRLLQRPQIMVATKKAQISLGF